MGPPETERLRTAGLAILAASSRKRPSEERVPTILDPIAPSDALERSQLTACRNGGNDYARSRDEWAYL
ncbi:hypothetical protein ACE1SV_08730 [Streptomyces sennicomposti]